MTKKQTILAWLTAIVAAVFLAAFFKGQFSKAAIASDSPTPSAKKILVVTSFYPLYFLTSRIGADQIELLNLTPSGAEPHDYEPNARDITMLEKSALVIVNGAGLEPWYEATKKDLQKNKVRVLEAAKDLDRLQVMEGGKSVTDPHVWLDPVLAAQEVTKITQALSEVDPDHRSIYEANGRRVNDELAVLDQEFSQGLAQCRQKNIITSHQAFGYLAARYQLHQIAIAGISPDSDPTPAELGRIVQFSKAQKVKYIFSEALVSPRLAETLAEEVEAKVLVFDPLEGLTPEDQAAGKDYFSIQRDNLRLLRTALECL